MKLTEIAAWWGAGIATVVLFWDIYKWLKTGPIVSFKVSTNIKVFAGLEKDDKTYVTVRVTNNGDRTTTITIMGVAYYESWINHIFRKPKSKFSISTDRMPNPLPFKLKPGSIWDGTIIQDDNVEQMACNGYLECHIYYSDSEKPKKKRIKISKSKVN